MRVSVALILLLFCLSGGEAVLCYACTYQGPHPDLPDYQCVVAPINVTTGSPTVNCPNGCTASSEVEIDNGVVMSFARGCYYNNTVTTQCSNIDSTGERHCDFVCDTDLCNGATSIDTNPPTTNGATSIDTNLTTTNSATSIDTNPPTTTSNRQMHSAAPSTHKASLALLLVIATILVFL